MGVGDALRDMGRFLDECEQRRQITSVDLAFEGAGDGCRIAADLELSLSACPDAEAPGSVSFAGADVAEDGRLRLTFEPVEDALPECPAGVDLDVADAELDADGTITVAVTASMGIEGDGDRDGAAANGGTEGGAGDDHACDPSRPERPDEREGRETEREDRRGDDDGATIRTDEREGESDGGSGRTDGRSGQSDGGSGRSDGGSDRSDGGSGRSDGRSGRSDGGSGRTDGGNGRTDGDPGDRTTGSQRSRDVPPFRDPELLREVYDSCDTFAEMSEALGMDVTAETVRRYMIDHDIHEPSSYDTDGDGADADARDSDLASPVAIADGIGLPEDVTVDTLVDVLRRSNTIYDVETELDIERDDAVAMLQKLDLTEYVAGRLASKDEREISRDLLVERLRRHAEPT